jgi:hypothetical protein
VVWEGPEWGRKGPLRLEVVKTNLCHCPPAREMVGGDWAQGEEGGARADRMAGALSGPEDAVGQVRGEMYTVKKEGAARRAAMVAGSWIAEALRGAEGAEGLGNPSRAE